jgi:hypothetical protein
MEFDNKFTKREIMFSIVIVLVMLMLGLVISSSINDMILDENTKYTKAIEINNDKELFAYGMRTNVGNAYVYGTLNKVDTVSYDAIKDKDYVHLEKVTQRYTMHTRRIAHKSGKTTYYTTQTYWTWDTINRESKIAKEITFLNQKYKINKISNIIDDDYIDTISTGYHLREKYYGAKLNNVKGTVYCNLKNKTINNATFYKDTKIKECKEQLMQSSHVIVIVFWILWIILIGGIVYGFGMINNKWLEG